MNEKTDERNNLEQTEEENSESYVEETEENADDDVVEEYEEKMEELLDDSEGQEDEEQLDESQTNDEEQLDERGEQIWDVVGFVISSRYRTIVLKRLASGPAPPSQIADDYDVGIAHVSRALQDLKEKELVDLLVSENRKKGRVYGITDDGREALQYIDKESVIS